MLIRWIFSSLLLGVIGLLNYASANQERHSLRSTMCEDCQKEHANDYPADDEPLVIIKDSEVPLSEHGTENYARLTTPEGLLVLGSTIPGAGLGVFSKEFIADGVMFGPYRGEIEWDRDGNPHRQVGYAWTIFNENKTVHYVESRNPAKSNYLRYVNCARSYEEQNMDGHQMDGDIYYVTIRAVYPGEELLVYYGDQYARVLGIEMEKKRLPENPLILFDNEYTVTVETGNEYGDGTDATVYVTAEGEYGFISYTLMDEDGTKFERGNIDQFEFSMQTNVGKIHSIRVGHDNNGGRGWYLVKLTMTGNITKQMLVFHCDCWLDDVSGAEVLKAESVLDYILKLGLQTDDDQR
ncbi:PR domain zinc finger protein 1-like [Lineus longissimus]|uniref:PR domain zinc finger protein 1-like n=1 Tax=Lineus longissimus TaxID=88925 RepID=UPI00315CC389